MKSDKCAESVARTATSPAPTLVGKTPVSGAWITYWKLNYFGVSDVSNRLKGSDAAFHPFNNTDDPANLRFVDQTARSINEQAILVKIDFSWKFIALNLSIDSLVPVELLSNRLLATDDDPNPPSLLRS